MRQQLAWHFGMLVQTTPLNIAAELMLHMHIGRLLTLADAVNTSVSKLLSNVIL